MFTVEQISEVIDQYRLSHDISEATVGNLLYATFVPLLRNEPDPKPILEWLTALADALADAADEVAVALSSLEDEE